MSLQVHVGVQPKLSQIGVLSNVDMYGLARIAFIRKEKKPDPIMKENYRHRRSPLKIRFFILG